VTTVKVYSSTKSVVLQKTLNQALASECATDIASTAVASPCDTLEVVRCQLCSKRYSSALALSQHEEICPEYIFRDKSELVASALTEFFTLSKQQFAATRARALSACEAPGEEPELQSQRGWAEKESVNEFAVLPSDVKEAISTYFSQERELGRKVKPHDVASFLMESIVASTDWDAKFLLTEQRLKTEISRLAQTKS
jgi:hypothetical protein